MLNESNEGVYRRETGDRRGKMGNGVGLKKQVCKVQFSRASVSLRP